MTGYIKNHTQTRSELREIFKVTATALKLRQFFRLRYVRGSNHIHHTQCDRDAMNHSWGREPRWELQPYREYDASLYESLIVFV